MSERYVFRSRSSSTYCSIVSSLKEWSESKAIGCTTLMSTWSRIPDRRHYAQCSYITFYHFHNCFAHTQQAENSFFRTTVTKIRILYGTFSRLMDNSSVPTFQGRKNLLSFFWDFSEPVGTRHVYNGEDRRKRHKLVIYSVVVALMKSTDARSSSSSRITFTDHDILTTHRTRSSLKHQQSSNVQNVNGTNLYSDTSHILLLYWRCVL